MTQSNPPGKLGIWFVGALGDVATTTTVGLLALKHKLIDETGLTTALPQFAHLDWKAYDQFVIGGHDIRPGSWREAAATLDRQIRSFGPELLTKINADLDAASVNLRSGIVRGTSHKLQGIDPNAKVESALESVAKVKRDLQHFRAIHNLDSVIVVHLTSTEPAIEPQPWFNDAGALHNAIEVDAPALPASVLYAYAAFQSRCHFVNFTPCLGSSIPCMEQIAKEHNCVHAGKDGKTGETLLRTVLAPMFAARHLRVLSWSGFNILGNRDGQVLSDPLANHAKTSGKDAVLKSVLGDLLDESLTRIDYVKSLKDFKTAWDYIHFEGFLNTKMSMQITWQGADSALAAPLVLDLVRLCDLAARNNKTGVLPALSCFFKNPIGSTENAFDKQFMALTEFILKDLAPAI